MGFGAVPALLTLFIRFFVPESRRWEKERSRGATSHWANRDLLAGQCDVAGALALCQNLAHRSLDSIGDVGTAEGISEHHRQRQDRRQRIRFILAGNVGR